MNPATPASGRARPGFFARALAVILSLSLLWLNACTTTKFDKVASPPPAKLLADSYIVGVTLVDGTEVPFDGYARLSNGVIEGKVKHAPYRTPVANVSRVWLKTVTVDGFKTAGVILLSVVVVLGAIAAASCPFVYSWNGSEYVLDAEPYGGAISRGLERSDFAELTNLRAIDGKYRLLVTNEVDETQQTNLMELWVVDHAPGSRVIADEQGVLRELATLRPPTAARNRAGRDVLPWLTANDAKIWEPACVAGPDGSLREELILTFDRPAGAMEGTLVAHAGTGLWGSSMIKAMTELRGREAPYFLAAIDQQPEVAKAVHEWGAREETFRLNIEVEEAGGWVVRGAIPGGGPMVTEERAIPLDLSRVAGDKVRIRMRPPVGFWAFNAFALAAGPAIVATKNAVQIESARTNRGEDVRPDLSAADNRYYAMPLNTDCAELVFPAPRADAGKQRTVFLHTRGWYELHLRQSGEPDRDSLERIANVPGGAVQFAAEYYQRMLEQYRTAAQRN